MPRHSFIQMSKLPNVKGRISYITSHARQENLYATYRTADSTFWSNLARESQQEFQRSGTEGKCIEARELIIALPEVYTRYEPQEVLEDFTEEFAGGMVWSACQPSTTTNARQTIISILSSAKENCSPSLTSREPHAACYMMKRAKGYAPRKKSQGRTDRYEKAAPS